MSSSLSTRGLARASARRPWIVVGIWVALLVIGGVLQGVPGLNSTTEFTYQNNPESQQGFDLLVDHGIRPELPSRETIIVRADSTTVDDPAFQQTVQQVTDALRSHPELVVPESITNTYEIAANNPTAGANLVSDDKTMSIIPVTMVGDIDTVSDNATDYLAIVEESRAAAPDFEIMTVGDASINEEINTIVEEDIARGEGIGIAFALVILVFVFAALLAAGLPIILAVMSIVIASGLAALLSQAFELSFFVTNMITMIGLAVGIDYSLFVVERYREERRHGMARPDAIAIAGGTASRSVLFSGLTVVFALAGMFIVPNNIYRSLSVGAILVVLVAVAATMTLIPALLALLGDRIDWPRRRTYNAETVAAQDRWDHETIHAGFWGRITRQVMARPLIFAALAVGLLLAAASPFLDFKDGLGGASQLPQDTESKEAFDLLSANFSAGQIAPVEIVFDGPVTDPAVQSGIESFQQTLANEKDANGQPVFGPSSVTPAEDGEVALLSVPLKVAPDTQEAVGTIKHLRDDLVPPAEEGMPDTEILVTGLTAANADFFDMRETYTPIVFAFVLGLSFILLLLVFRSLVIAAKAIVMNLLSVGAAYGLLVLVFQKGYGADFFSFQKTPAIEAWIPLFLFSVLFGLSMDYHVFLISRIREHWDETHRNAESVAVGLQATAKIITGAALIMVAVFGGFAAGRLSFMEQFGFGLGVAVLIDATIVRSILVPSAMALLGNWNWYLPRWLQWLPDLRMEGRPAVAQEAGLDTGSGD